MKYRKKPIQIEAIQYLGPFSFDEMFYEWGEVFENTVSYDTGVIKLYAIEPTSEGPTIVRISDYIIKDMDGGFYRCEKSVFLATYEKVEE